MNLEEHKAQAVALVRDSLKPRAESAPASTEPSPYDEEIAKLQSTARRTEDRQRLSSLYWCRLGYRQAKAEDAEVLAAALAHIAQLHQTDQALFACETADRIREALTPSTSTT